jgi:hypothetical protein
MMGAEEGDRGVKMQGQIGSSKLCPVLLMDAAVISLIKGPAQPEKPSQSALCGAAHHSHLQVVVCIWIHRSCSSPTSLAAAILKRPTDAPIIFSALGLRRLMKRLKIF